LVYRYLGLKFVSRSWFNLDATWAVSLMLVGALSLAIILVTRTEPGSLAANLRAPQRIRMAPDGMRRPC
jgi:hypothetical protein